MILNDLDWKNIPDSINEVAVVLTTDKKIHKLNLEYRNKDKPTDVLSFSQIENVSVPFNTFLGDIVISLDTAKVQAKKYQHSLFDEVFRLAVHGLLHLMGYDHEGVSANEALTMRRLEKKIINKYN